MSKICGKCNNTKRVIGCKEFLPCFGHCNKSYHVECLDWKFGGSENWLKVFKDCPYAVFMCLDCQRDFQNERRVGSSEIDSIKATVENLESSVALLSENIATSCLNMDRTTEVFINSCAETASLACSKIGDQIADQIRNCFAHYSAKSTIIHENQTTKASTPSYATAITGGLTSEPRSSYESICGTKPPSSLPSNIRTIKPKFWFHLSQFEPSVDDTEVTNFVNDSLGISNAAVTKLIPKGRDIDSLEFVCFKVGVESDLKEKVLCMENWPNTVFVRPFDNSNFRPRRPHRLPQRPTSNIPRHPRNQSDSIFDTQASVNATSNA